jgi:hypothetical protein
MAYRDEQCQDLTNCGVLVLVTCGVLICVVLGGVVVADYRRVELYESRSCSGSLISTDVHQSGVKCARGKAVTQFGSGTNVSEFNQTVELFYPPVNWLIVCKKSSDIEDWLSGLAASKTFHCLVDNPEANTGLPDGVRTNYDQIGGWISMIVISVLGLVCLLGLFCYWIWTEKCKRPAMPVTFRATV